MAGKKTRIYLGDPEYTKKMMKVYGWIMPVVFLAMALAMFVYRAWITGLIFLAGLLLTLPYFRPFWDRLRIGSFLKLILCALLIALAVYSIRLYV